MWYSYAKLAFIAKLAYLDKGFCEMIAIPVQQMVFISFVITAHFVDNLNNIFVAEVSEANDNTFSEQSKIDTGI